MKRLILLITAIMIMLTGCEAVIESDNVLGAYGNTDDEQTEDTAKMEDLTLLYYPDMDVNPITSEVYANHELLKLVYSPLIRLNERLEPYCVLAGSYTLEGDTYTVKIREGITFSDGSAVTAQDVKESFDVAKANKNSPYYTQVSAFSKYYAKDSSTFVCVCREKDADAAALLDIPIMKDGKAGIGCGPYVFSEQNGKQVLIPSESYFKKAQIPLIKLVDTKTDTHISSLFSAGELDVIAVAGNDDLSLTSLRDYQIVTYPSNNFIYIGVNHQNEFLKNAEVRRAISTIIDRKKAATQELVGLAEGTVYPFNPSWYRLGIYNAISLPEYNEDSALNAAKVMGDTVLTLIIPEGSDIKTSVAESIAQSFKNVGLTIDIKALPAEDYRTAVQTGNFDLYIGETAIRRDMDPTFLYATDGSMNYTGYSNAELDSLFEQYKASVVGLDKYLEMFSNEMPIIPVMFRKNVMYAASGLKNMSSQSIWSSFGDITTATIN